VVVLTTSESDEDILGTYGSHANCYITKPVDIDQFVRVVKLIEEFGFIVAKIPNGRGG
jgi:chemotaxis family two-component system response regulator Rcp1